jgi:hypothetical protein
MYLGMILPTLEPFKRNSFSNFSSKIGANPSSKVITQIFKGLEGKDFFCQKSQGCQIFIGTIYQNEEKHTKLPQNIPNDHKI